MVNLQLLAREIAKSGLKQGKICEELGLSRQGFYLKINGKRDFKINECYTLASLLGFDEMKIREIFFAPNVDPKVN